MKRLFRKKLKKLQKKYKNTKKKLSLFLYLSKRRNCMGCNCAKNKGHIGKRGKDVIISDPSARMFLCSMCPSSIENRIVGLTCGKLARPVKNETCGCILNIKTKLKDQRCPQGKW
jgi:hypothetical protein